MCHCFEQQNAEVISHPSRRHFGSERIGNGSMELVSKKSEREALRLVIEFSFSSHSITLSCYQKKQSGSFSADLQVGLRCALEKGLWWKPDVRRMCSSAISAAIAGRSLKFLLRRFVEGTSIVLLDRHCFVRLWGLTCFSHRCTAAFDWKNNEGVGRAGHLYGKRAVFLCLPPILVGHENSWHFYLSPQGESPKEKVGCEGYTRISSRCLNHWFDILLFFITWMSCAA